MKHGPVDVVVLATTDPKFEGGILDELERLAESGTIRVLDALLLMMDGEGATLEIDMEDLDERTRNALGYLELGKQGLFKDEDAQVLLEGMVPGSTVVAIAIENTWATRLLTAMEDAGTELAMHWRVPAPVVEDAFASIGQ